MARLSEDEIKAYVRDNLARYKVPREVVFLDELPRNATGKVLKRELQERARTRAARGEMTGDPAGASGAQFPVLTERLLLA